MNKYCDFYFVCGVFFTEAIAYNPDNYMPYFNNIEFSYLNTLNLSDSNSSESVYGTGSYLAAFNLGIFYELTNNINSALNYYSLSYTYNYLPALNRLNLLNNNN